MNCQHCKAEFTPVNKWQTYCQTKCRIEAFNARKNALQTHQNNPSTNAFRNDMPNEHIEQILERLLSEREAVYQAKLQQIQTEHDKKILELKVTEMEKRLYSIEQAQQKIEKENEGGGISMPDIMNAAAMYFATQHQQNNTSQNGTK